MSMSDPIADLLTRIRNGQAAEIRRWGRENGYEVPTRGRIPVAVRTAWSKEHDGIAPVTLQR